MRFEEVSDPQYLDEGVLSWLRNAALAGVLAAGGSHLLDRDSKVTDTSQSTELSTNKPSAMSQQSTVTTKPTAKPTPDTVTDPVQTLKKIQAETPEERKSLLKKMAQAAGIKGEELQHFLSQSAHETMDFRALEEIGDADRRERKYGVRSRKGSILGNTRPGDGMRFRGRGFMHLTGKYNYHRIGQMLGLDLVNNPDLVSRNPGVAAATAIAYWKWRVAPKVNFKSPQAVTKVTRQVSGSAAEKHLKRRIEKFRGEKPKTGQKHK